MPRRVRSKNNRGRKSSEAKKAKKAQSKKQLRAFAAALNTIRESEE